MQQILSKPWLYGMLNPPGAASAALAPDAPWAGWRRGLVVGPGGGTAPSMAMGCPQGTQPPAGRAPSPHQCPVALWWPGTDPSPASLRKPDPTLDLDSPEYQQFPGWSPVLQMILVSLGSKHWLIQAFLCKKIIHFSVGDLVSPQVAP